MLDQLDLYTPIHVVLKTSVLLTFCEFGVTSRQYLSGDDFLFSHCLLQARRADVNCVILPEGNRKDFADLPEFVKEGLEVHFVSHYNDVYRIAFDS